MSDLKEILLNKNVEVPEDYETFKKIFRHFKGKDVGDIRGDDGPLMDRADEFYSEPSSTEGFLQGDIISDIPSTWIQLKDGNLTAFSSASGYAMVLSAECDCEKRSNGSSQSYIRLCPVLFQSDVLYGTPENLKSDIKGKLIRNYYTEYFWMPSSSKGENPLVADFSHIFSISLEDLYSKVGDGTVHKKLSLSQKGYFVFLLKMAWFMLRPEAPDSKRKSLKPWKVE